MPKERKSKETATSKTAKSGKQRKSRKENDGSEYGIRYGISSDAVKAMSEIEPKQIIDDFRKIEEWFPDKKDACVLQINDDLGFAMHYSRSTDTYNLFELDMHLGKMLFIASFRNLDSLKAFLSYVGICYSSGVAVQWNLHK